MTYEFKLPDLGEGLTEGEVARWLVKEGATIAEDDPLVEVQTDKTTVEIPSPYGGVVSKILVAEGEIVPVGTVLVVIADGDQPDAPTETQLDSPVVAEGQPASSADAPIAEIAHSAPSQEAGREERIRATPLVRRIAAELGVDLAVVVGSGPNGQVVEADVRASAASLSSDERREKVRGTRRAIVEHLTTAHREVPAVTFVEECDFTGLDVRRIVARTLQVVAETLPEYPELNARLEGDEIVYLTRYDLGIAVQTPDGLVVPVVRECDQRTLDEIDAEVRRLAEGAREGTLTPAELRGSTFTVTSAGKLGGLLVTPLVNYPEVGILGVHRINHRPVVRDGEVVVRSIGNISLTFDHRVVDGARAAAFCLDIIGRLQAP